jgi:hypothetical protein
MAAQSRTGEDTAEPAGFAFARIIPRDILGLNECHR